MDSGSVLAEKFERETQQTLAAHTERVIPSFTPGYRLLLFCFLSYWVKNDRANLEEVRQSLKNDVLVGEVAEVAHGRTVRGHRRIPHAADGGPTADQSIRQAIGCPKIVVIRPTCASRAKRTLQSSLR